MAHDLLNNTFLIDGVKSVPLNALPPEAWVFLTGEGPDVAELKEHYEKVPWLYRAVWLRSQRLSNVPFVILRGDDEIDNSEDYQNKLGWLPDPFTLLEQVEADLVLHSRAYLLKEKNVMRRALGVRRLHPPTIRPRVDKERGLFGFVRTIQGVQVPPLDLDEVVYFHLPDPWSELGRARSPAESALSAAGVLMNMDDFAIAFFKRGAVKVTLLTVSGSIQEDERNRLESWWKRVVGGIQNAFSGRVVNADRVEPVQIGEGVKELGNQNLSKEKREDIATALGIPQSLMFSTGTVNRAVSQQDDVNFYTDTILPEAKRIERTLNAQLFQEQGVRMQFRPQEMAVFQEDENMRSMALLNLVQAGETLDNAYQILGFDIPEELRDDRLIMMSSANGANPLSNELRHLEQWRRKSLKEVQRGKRTSGFKSEYISEVKKAAIEGALSEVTEPQEVNDIFDPLIWKEYP